MSVICAKDTRDDAPTRQPTIRFYTSFRYISIRLLFVMLMNDLQDILLRSAMRRQIAQRNDRHFAATTFHR